MDRAAAIQLLEDTHSFPSDHVFRVIVRSEVDAIEAVLQTTRDAVGMPDLGSRVVHVPSSGGRWTSLRLTLTCESAAKVLDMYALFQGHPDVVRVL